MKWLNAFNVGMMVLNAIEGLVTGMPVSIPFSWRGKKYIISLLKSS